MGGAGCVVVLLEDRCVDVDVTGGDRPPDGCCVGVGIRDKDLLSEGRRDAVGVTGRDRVLVLLFAIWLVF